MEYFQIDSGEYSALLFSKGAPINVLFNDRELLEINKIADFEYDIVSMLSPIYNMTLTHNDCRINKLNDEWFLVKNWVSKEIEIELATGLSIHAAKSSDSYKCDQLHGLLECLRSITFK